MNGEMRQRPGTLALVGLRADFVPANDEHHLPGPRIHEAGPAGIQDDVVSVLSTKPDGRVFKGGLACKLQDCAESGDKDRAGSTEQDCWVPPEHTEVKVQLAQEQHPVFLVSQQKSHQEAGKCFSFKVTGPRGEAISAKLG